jgi:DNA-binding response OmpR family regulator
MATVLIIEDEAPFRSLLVQALNMHGYDVLEAGDGDEGLKRMRSRPVDLVVTDIVMPNREGLATIMELRRDYPRLGIIVMSGGQAKDAPLYLLTAKSLGADYRLLKPFALSELIRAAADILEQGGHQTDQGKQPSRLV